MTSDEFFDEYTAGRRNFDGVSLQGEVMSVTELSDVSLKDANLEEIVIWGARIDRSDFSGANMLRASIKETSFHNCNMSKVNLQEADISSSAFWDTDLSEATLANASLFEASLLKMSLKNTDLTGVTFFEVAASPDIDFIDAIGLSEWDLQGVYEFDPDE
jgi:uncharacterized protein YjbI with pentapeptide repeats